MRSEEARLSRQPRSQLMREALETLLCQRRHERAQAALKLPAVALASDAGACEETRDLAADFLMTEQEAPGVPIPARNRIGEGPLTRLSPDVMGALEPA